MKSILRAAAIAPSILLAAAVFATAHPAAAAQLCDDGDLSVLANRPAVAWSPCVVGDGQVLLETGYYQNASSVFGGSAIAEYPNAELRVGFDPKLELLIDPPTQVDVSGNHGRGFFSLSDPGVGFKYQLEDQHSSALEIGGEIRPPSTAASFHAQPDYRLEVDSTRLVGSKLQATLGLGLVDQSRIAKALPTTPALRSSAARGYATSQKTTVSLELLDQASVARSLRGQSFGDLALRQTLSRRVLFDIEGGQTFNTSARTRPHYIGAGFTFGSAK